VVLEFDHDAPPTIALLRSGTQCKDAVEKERQTQNPSSNSLAECCSTEACSHSSYQRSLLLPITRTPMSYLVSKIGRT
jgi:hypothetical protein